MPTIRDFGSRQKPRPQRRPLSVRLGEGEDLRIMVGGGNIGGFRVELSRGPAGMSVRVEPHVGTAEVTFIPGETFHGIAGCQYNPDEWSQAFKIAYAEGKLTEFHAEHGFRDGSGAGEQSEGKE